MIWRCRLAGADVPSVIVKAIDVHAPMAVHPRGWQGDRSHQRKLKSYAVECCFYREYSARISSPHSACRVPTFLAESRPDNAPWLLIMEDLQVAHFSPAMAQEASFYAGLDWLAAFHAHFLGCEASGLWEQGTYWHLATRPDELAVMPDGPLKQRATDLDAALNASPFKTLVHGDAKIANFCSTMVQGEALSFAAVDFQYVGGGCGITDVAYFIGSMLSEADCRRLHHSLLEYYADSLRCSIENQQPAISADAVVEDWLERYPLACADFTRFLQGWSPGHHKLHAYSQDMTNRALRFLET